MNKILDIYISKANEPENEAYASLSLPAMPYELFDALDKARILQGDESSFEITEYHAFECMEPFISESGSVLELNALCQKLSELDERQGIAFEGLVKAEIEKKTGAISIGRLIDLAFSADCCHVVCEAINDESLGNFYAENGFVPAVEALPDSIYKMFNFAYIGKEMREGEGGVFTSGGYVVQHTDLVEAYKDMTFTMRTPDYQILLEDMQGNRFELPQQALAHDGEYACLDCRVPQLMAAIDTADLKSVNDFAEMLQGMGDKPMRKYKAMLSAIGCESLEDAVEIAGHMDDYLYEESVTSSRDAAMGELTFMLDKKDADLLAQYTNLHGYGQAIMARDNSAITPYGLLEREDHQPLQCLQEQKPCMGMEMS